MMHDEFDAAAIKHFQTFFDLFTAKGIFPAPLDVTTMLYKG